MRGDTRMEQLNWSGGLNRQADADDISFYFHFLSCRSWRTGFAFQAGFSLMRVNSFLRPPGGVSDWRASHGLLSGIPGRKEQTPAWWCGVGSGVDAGGAPCHGVPVSIAGHAKPG
jgi:hypothetical protein